jgi:hypothetical protein
MAHAALAPGIGREFDPFLFASIGEGRHGQPVTVLSALAQSGVDPWLEAVGLARSSRELATARLSRLIAALPGPPASSRPADSIAEELVALLPRTNRSAPPSQASAPSAPPMTLFISPNARFGLAVSVLALLIVISLLFSTHTLPGTGRDGAPVASEAKDPAGGVKPRPSDHRP